MRKQESSSSPKQDGGGDLLPPGYISPQSAIRHQKVRGREIHQNSLCSVRYTKEPLRIRDGPLCLWLSTLRPIPSSCSPAWCELINHSNGLTWPASLSRCTFTHHRMVTTWDHSYTLEYCYFSALFLVLDFSFLGICT